MQMDLENKEKRLKSYRSPEWLRLSKSLHTACLNLLKKENVTPAELDEKIGVDSGEVAWYLERLEKGEDVYLSGLIRIIHALGYTMNIKLEKNNES